MSVKEKFKGFTYQDNEKYKQVAVDTYGKEVIAQAIETQKGKEKEIADGFNEIFFAFSENLSNRLSPTSKENIGLAEKLHKHLCEYAFDFLSLSQLYSHVATDNEVCIKLFTFCGFVQCGLLKNWLQVEGTYKDAIIFQCLNPTKQ